MSEEISGQDVYQNLTVRSAVCLRLALILTLKCNSRNIVEISLAVHHIFEGSLEKIFISKKSESHFLVTISNVMLIFVVFRSGLQQGTRVKTFCSLFNFS